MSKASSNISFHVGTEKFTTNRWGNSEAVTDLIFLGSKITVDGYCSHKVKRHLFFGRKAMTSLDSILKSRDQKKICTLVYQLGFRNSNCGFSEICIQ